jgi:hypothetical protein
MLDSKNDVSDLTSILDVWLTGVGLRLTVSSSAGSDSGTLVWSLENTPPWDSIDASYIENGIDLNRSLRLPSIKKIPFLLSPLNLFKKFYRIKEIINKFKRTTRSGEVGVVDWNGGG